MNKGHSCDAVTSIYCRFIPFLHLSKLCLWWITVNYNGVLLIHTNDGDIQWDYW